MSGFSSKPLFNINIFTLKSGRLDEFIGAQLDAAPRLGDISGLSESRLFRAEDGSRAILMACFASVEAHREFQNGAAFQEERAKLRPLLEATQAGFYRLVHERDR